MLNGKKYNRLRNLLAERIPLESFNYEVPAHANTFWFSLGGITLINIVILVVSGIFLTQFYNPDPEVANSTIRHLVTGIPAGKFIRSLHYWAAQAVMVTLVLHLLRVFFHGSYKKPREFNWLLGVGLFLVMTGLYYTGTILKWDQEAAEALEHTVSAVKLLGLPAFFFNNSPDGTIPLLTKMFSLHTGLLPLLVIMVLFAHLYLVKALKISPLPGSAGTEKPEPGHTFRQHLFKLTGYGLILFGILTILGVLLPPDVGPVPVKGIEATKPPWLFMSIFSIENWFGLWGLVFAAVLLVIALVSIPFIDRTADNTPARRKPVIAGGALAVVLIVTLTTNAYLAEPEQHMVASGEKSGPAAATNEANNDVSNNEGRQEKDAQKTREISAELQALNQAESIMERINSRLIAKDYAAAQKETRRLDRVIDAIKTKIAAKNAHLAEDLGAIHEVEEYLESPHPDLNKISEELEHIAGGIEKSKGLFRQ